MALKKYEKEIEIIIKAQYPIIYIVSYEEERVLRSLKNIGDKLNKKIMIWTNTMGLRSYPDEGKPVERSRDPIIALNYIMNQDKDIIFVFLDLHLYLDRRRAESIVLIRKLRDLAHYIVNVPSSFIILSPVMNIPQELEKEISVFDFPLPDYQEVDSILRNIEKDIKRTKSLSFELSPEERDQIIRSTLGLTYTEIENVFAKVIAMDKKLNIDDLALILEEKKQLIRKSGILEFIEVKESFASIGGLNVFKNWIKERYWGFLDKAREYNLRPPRGVLLVGVPGCGKSLSAKVVSAEWNMPLLRLDMGRIYGKYVGESEANMRKAIKTAESIAPAVLWLDEIEKGLSGAYGFSDTSGVAPRVFGTFLTWMQEKEVPVFVFATANNISMLPPELVRKGRFDEIFFVDLPFENERRDIFEIHLKKRNLDPNRFNLAYLAKISEGYSGSEIEEVIVSALYKSFSMNREISDDIIVETLKETKPISETMREAISQMRAWAKTRARYASERIRDESGKEVKEKTRWDIL